MPHRNTNSAYLVTSVGVKYHALAFRVFSVMNSVLCYERNSCDIRIAATAAEVKPVHQSKKQLRSGSGWGEEGGDTSIQHVAARSEQFD